MSQRAAHAAPSLVGALRVHGQCVTVLGRFAEAVSLFDDALAVALTAEPQAVPPFELGLVHLGLGNRRAELGHLDAAAGRITHGGTEAADRCRELIVDEGSAAGLADAFTAAL